MKTSMSEEQIYEMAKKRVEEKKGLYTHIAVYILVNIMLVIIWAFPSGRGYPWFLWPLGGWGIALIIHFLTVYVFGEKSDTAAIEREAEKIKREQNQ